MVENAQLKHWEGNGGENYRMRQDEVKLISSYRAMWSQIMAKTGPMANTALELGANTGINLDALRIAAPGIHTTGLEVNKESCAIMAAKGHEAIQGTIQNFIAPRKYGIVFTRGVLIHLPEDVLVETYRLMHDATAKYIVIVEYYSPTPVEVPYRGQYGLLWKRDFAGELLDAYSDLTLVDYGFIYHRDEEYPQDDVTWFLLKKEDQAKLIPEFLKRRNCCPWIADLDDVVSDRAQALVASIRQTCICEECCTYRRNGL